MIDKRKTDRKAIYQKQKQKKQKHIDYRHQENTLLFLITDWNRSDSVL